MLRIHRCVAAIVLFLLPFFSVSAGATPQAKKQSTLVLQYETYWSPRLQVSDPIRKMVDFAFQIVQASMMDHVYLRPNSQHTSSDVVIEFTDSVSLKQDYEQALKSKGVMIGSTKDANVVYFLS